MLRELKVEQFALVEKLSVRFGTGLNVVTGETGAGKSLLVDALGLVVGGRARSELVRAGAEEAVVEALFESEGEAARAALDAALEARGLPACDGTLIVRRLVDAGGRHRVYLNGALATVGTLAEIAGDRVDISGQHEHLALCRPEAALGFVDAYAAATDRRFTERRARYAAAWEALREARAELDGLRIDPAERAEREAFLRFQLSELENVRPEPGEIDVLEAERRRLSGGRRLHELAAGAGAALYEGEEAVADVLARWSRRLEEAVASDPGLAPLAEGLGDAAAVVADLGRDVAAYARRVDDDPARLEVLEGRLSRLKALARRHGGDLEAAIAAAEGLRAELQALADHEARLADATRAEAEALRRAREAARRLGAARAGAAAALTEAVGARLSSLAMADSRLEVRVAPRGGAEDLGPSGGDVVDLGLAGGAGEPLRPLKRVASGGELSRILLALRRVLAQVDPVATCVFDEVDSGIGGAVAEVVGRLLAEVADGRQVLCVTHLPQVAAQGDHHVVVRKASGDRPRIEAGAVRGAAREAELARMLGGREVTRRGRAHAREILARARQAEAAASA